MHAPCIGCTISRTRRKIIIRNRRFHTRPDLFVKLIEIYAHDRALDLGKTLHAHVIINGLARLTIIATKLITFYAECKQRDDARKVFDTIPQTNISRWITLIGAYARCDNHQEALVMFSEMQREGQNLNKFAIPSVLKACGHVFDPRTGEGIHGMVLKSALEVDVFISTALIDMYSKCGQIEQAQRVFDGMQEKDVVALNAIVSGYAHHGFAKEALELVKDMELQGLKPDVVTWNTLIAGFSQKGDEVMASDLFRLMLANGIEPDLISWTTIISGLVKNFHLAEAFATFRQMVAWKFYPTSVTVSCLFPACANAANIRHGKELHGYALVIGVEEDIYVRSALVDMYAKCGLISEARTIFAKMPEKNTVTWNSMIFGYANHGYCVEAIELFNQMVKEDEVKVDHLTFTAALSACIHSGEDELGQSLFMMMQDKYKIIPRLEHYACIVDLLARAGKLAEAYDTIKTMPIKPDLFVWGALLAACRNHGDVDLAEVCTKHLLELEPESAGNFLLLANLYADVGNWREFAGLKKTIKRRKLPKFSGCSWMTSTWPCPISSATMSSLENTM